MTEVPRFSIIVPTYARPAQLRDCLAALNALDYPRTRFEVIVVDDGSPTPIAASIAAADYDITLYLRCQPNAGPAQARNTGAAQAQGRYIAFTDDDCAPAMDWLKQLATQLAATPAALVGGRTVNALPHNVFATASQALISYVASYETMYREQMRFAASNNMALAADRFHAIGGFNTTFPRAAGEDREFCDRWHESGYTVVYAPQAIVAHTHHLGATSFLQQHFNYGRAAFQVRHMRASRHQRGMRFERTGFYLRLLGYPFIPQREWRAVPTAALFGLSQVATTAGFYVERWQQSHRRLGGNTYP